MKCIKLYKANTTNYDNNGLGVLTMFNNDVVTEERNGQFYFEIDVHNNDPLFPLLERDAVLKCDASKDLKEQRFRIVNITKKSDGVHHFFCEHESYSLNRLAIKPNITLSNVSGQTALELWKQSLIGPDVYTVYSNVTRTNSTTWDIADVTSARLALGGVDGSILQKWGGEYRFDNNRISLLSARGKESGAVIAYGKNLITLEQEESIQEVYTCVFPFAKQTVDEVEKIYTIPGYIVESKYVNSYYHKKVLSVDFSSEFEQEEIPTATKLKSLAEAYIKNNNIGIPKVSLELSFMDLSDTEDYKDKTWYEEINLCDVVTVYFEKLGINVKAKVIETQYIPSLERYKQITIGEPRFTLSDKLKQMDKTASTLANQAQQTANVALTSANGKNTNYYGKDKPLLPRVGDLWYKTNGEYTEMWQYTTDGWILIVDDLNGIKLEEEMAENAKLIEEATKDAEMAKEEANTAVKNANDAIEKANQAAEQAGFSKTAADEAKNLAGTAISNASNSLAKAQEAWDAAEDAQIQLDTISDELSLKVSQNTFDDLNNKVTNQATQINANTTKINLAATKTELNTLNGKVNVVESNLNVQAGQIKATNSLVTNHTTQLTTLESSYKGLNSTVINVENNLNNLQIGGTNKLRESGRWEILPDVKHWRDNGGGLTLDKTVTYNGFNTLKTTVGHGISGYAIQWIPVSSGKVYTYSALIKSNIATTGTRATPIHIQISKADKISMGVNGYDVISYNQSIKENTWTILYLTFKVKNDGCYLRPYIFKDTGASAIFNIAYIKLEEGNKATDWSPAPEDMATVTQFSTLEQTVNGFQTTVNNSLTNQQSQITQLSGSLTSTVKDLANTDIKTRIATGRILSSDPTFLTSDNDILVYNNLGNGNVAITRENWPAGSQPTGSSYRMKVVCKGEAQPGWGGILCLTQSRINAEFVIKFTASLPKGYRFDRAQNSMGNGYICKWLTGQEGTGNWQEYMYYYKCGTGGTFSTFGHLYVTGEVAPTPENPLDWFLARHEVIDITASQQSQITQMANQITSTVNTVSGHTSQITQMGKDINLRVEKNNIVSQINISTEGILIAGNKIRITGQTTIDAGVIKTAHIGNAAITDAKIGDLSASKITTGELNASKVRIINLDASRIVSGTINASRIAAGSITAGKLAANAIQVGFNSMGNTLKLDSTSLSFYSGSTLAGKINKAGMEFWFGTKKIGNMGETYKHSYPSIRGISVDLETEGNFVTWGYRLKSTDNVFTSMLTLDPKGMFYTGIPGVHCALDFLVDSEKAIKFRYFRTVNYTTEAGGKLIPTTLAGALGFCISNNVGTAGIWIGNNGKVAIKQNGGSFIYV